MYVNKIINKQSGSFTFLNCFFNQLIEPNMKKVFFFFKSTTLTAFEEKKIAYTK